MFDKILKKPLKLQLHLKKYIQKDYIMSVIQSRKSGGTKNHDSLTTIAVFLGPFSNFIITMQKLLFTSS